MGTLGEVPPPQGPPHHPGEPGEPGLVGGPPDTGGDSRFPGSASGALYSAGGISGGPERTLGPHPIAGRRTP